MISFNRRHFIQAGATGLAGLAFAGLARGALAASLGETYLNQAPGYGPLVADPAGLLDLPQGFAYRTISIAGKAMDDGYIVPDNFDGMGCIGLDRHRVALVRNHELGLNGHALGPTGGIAARETQLTRLPVYGRDASGKVLPGGTTTLVYNLRSGRREMQYLSLAGTATNCAGGVTPWGSWLSCEETVLTQPDAEHSHGWIFEVPARQRGLVAPVPLKAMGRFRHEAAAVDPITGAVYLTEDRDDGLFYRFLPTVNGKLAQGGRLQALGFVDGGTDSRNWQGNDMTVGTVRELRWIDLDEVESPHDDLRLRGHAAGAVRFARGEGIHLGTRADGQVEFYFTCTSGGSLRHGQIMRLRPAADPAVAGTLELFFESNDARVMDYADNLTVAPWGHLVVCEDRAGKTAINHLRGVTPEGRSYTLARLNAETELAGACFSPDGSTLFVNIYSPGKTVAITGPWHRFAAA